MPARNFSLIYSSALPLSSTILDGNAVYTSQPAKEKLIKTFLATDSRIEYETEMVETITSGSTAHLDQLCTLVN